MPLIPEPILAADDGLDDGLGALADHRRTWAPVVADGRLVGVLSVQDAMAAYRTALSGNVRQMRGLRTGGVIVEGEITPDSDLAGKRVAEVPWPKEAVLVAIERGEALVVPRGDFELSPGDRISIFATPTAGRSVEALFEVRRGAPGDPPVPESAVLSGAD
jgi:CBS domain-containing protein